MTVTVVVISDTHNRHRRLPALPDGDILVHAGDFTLGGTQKEILDFNDWLKEQPHAYKIVVPGNHDIEFYESWHFARSLLSAADFVLNDKGVEVMGKKFWGSPWTPNFGDWAFMYDEREAEARWAQIPGGLDMLITHGPPKGILDNCVNYETRQLESVGCEHLHWEVTNRARPKVHVFGHIHESHGQKDLNGTLYVNAAQLDDRLQPSSERGPIVVTLK